MIESVSEDAGVEPGDAGVGAEETAPEPVVDPFAADPLISNAALERGAAGLSSLWKIVQTRAPRDVRRRVRETLERIFAITTGAATGEMRERVFLSRQIDDLGSELRGQPPFEPHFYQAGKLAIISVYDPIQIRGAVDHRRIERAFDRYLSRAERAFARLDYFLERAGEKVEKKADLKPWEQPYAKFDNFRELLWGRVQRIDWSQ
ncbi:MAG: hypothetical protein KC635_05475 [Myxococcales bacterium]|nr:hypothetical protein [Myxococcales bacterium]MCB9733907.1 hypothetical protein [Deltaproteobacteria bacterium]